MIVTIYILNAIGSPFAEGGLLRYLDPENEFHLDQKEQEQQEQQQANDDNNYVVNEVALLSIILGFGTTATIFFLRGFKTSPYFCNQEVRNAVHDFAVTTAVIVWTVVANFGFSGVSLPGLHVSDRFQPTYTCCDASCTTYWPDECETQEAPAGVRPWIADLGDLNGKAWVPIMAGGLALLAFILLYLDNGITWHFLYNPSHKLTHGPTYNWDLFLNGVCNLVNGMLGLPWLVSTTVPCIVHLHNLAEKDKNGQIIHVQETRLTFLGSHTILGLSLLFLSTLKQIPLPVLLGVFLFMGLSSMPSLQFWQRFLLFFQQPSQYSNSDKPYIKYMETKRIHYYTLFQLVFFLGVFVVQNTESIAMVFPFMTLLCIPARIYLAPMFFEGWELCLLDGYDAEVDAWLALKKQASEANDMMEGCCGGGGVVDSCCPTRGDTNDDDDAVSGTTSRQTTDNREDDEVLVVVKLVEEQQEEEEA